MSSNSNLQFFPSSLLQTYNTTPRPVKVISEPYGISIYTTYLGTGDTFYPITSKVPIYPGTYTVSAHPLNLLKYDGSCLSTLQINYLRPIVYFNLLNRKYNGNPLSPIISSSPHVPLTITYNGSSVIPIEPGEYILSAISNDPYIIPELYLPYTFNIYSQKIARIELLNLLQYSLEVIPVSGIAYTSGGQPLNLPIVITYKDLNGTVISKPDYAGDYIVSGTISLTDNYKNGSYYNGHAQDYLRVRNSGEFDIIVEDNDLLDTFYDNTPKNIRISTNPPNIALDVQWAEVGRFNNYSNPIIGNPIDAGYYTGIIKAKDQSFWITEKTISLIINKIVPNITIPDQYVKVTGNPLSVNVIINPSSINISNILYDGSLTIPTFNYVTSYVHDCAIIVALDDPNIKNVTYGHGDMWVLPQTGWEMVKVRTFGLNRMYHSGNKLPIDIVTTPPLVKTDVGIYYNNNIAIPYNVGTYNVTLSANILSAGIHYVYYGKETLNIFSGGPVVITARNLVQKWDGNPKEPNYFTQPTGSQLSLEFNYYLDNIQVIYPTDIGEYNIYTKVTSPGGYYGEYRGIFNIVSGNLTISFRKKSLNQKYDGNPKSVAVVTDPPRTPVIVYYKDNSDLLNPFTTIAPSDIGTYTVNVSAKNASIWTGENTAQLTIS